MNLGYVLACDVCGAPVANIAQDVYVRENQSNGTLEFSPVGNLKLGCDEHPAKSEQIEVGGYQATITRW